MSGLASPSPNIVCPRPQRPQSQMGNIARWRYTQFSLNASEMVGAPAPVLPAFLAIQSRAAWTLSSVPALSWQTVTENPPSAVRAIE